MIENVLMLVSEVLNTAVPFFNKKKHMLLFQVLIQIPFIITYLLTGAFEMITLCIVVSVRNIYTAHTKPSKWTVPIFLVVGTALCVLTNKNSWWGLLPVIGYINYCLVIMVTESTQKIRAVILTNYLLYIPYNIFLGLWTGLGFTLFHMITTAVSMWKYREEVS